MGRLLPDLLPVAKYTRSIRRVDIRRDARKSGVDGRAYLVRLRFCRARGLLSTSGGRLRCTVSGEWTRNARLLDVGLESTDLAVPGDVAEEEGEAEWSIARCS